VGTGSVAEPLLALLRTGNDPCLTEVVAALGRLAERGVLVEQQRGAVADALLATFGDTQPSQAALRERVLWAMSLVADPRFAPAFVAALAESEATAVRQAGLRGIAALKDPRLADTLVPLVSEGDPALRRSAVEALAGLASCEEHLAALWARSDPAQEPDESIRRAAWDGAVRLVSDRAVADVDWVVRLPRDGPERAGRALELLVAMEALLADVAEARGELGRVRARIAAERAMCGEVDEAVTVYLAALGDLHAGQSAEIPRIAMELLRLALAHGRYDEAVAAALAGGNPPLDGAVLWEGIKGDIEKRLTPEQADQARQRHSRRK
jgi:HEAT repeat protein